VEAFVDKRWRDAGRHAAEDYWCRFFAQVLKDDKGEGKRFVLEARDAQKRGSGEGQRVLKFGEYVKARERDPRLGDGAAALLVFGLLDAFGTFEGEK
jgi:hypothetical protein